MASGLASTMTELSQWHLRGSRKPTAVTATNRPATTAAAIFSFFMAGTLLVRGEAERVAVGILEDALRAPRLHVGRHGELDALRDELLVHLHDVGRGEEHRLKRADARAVVLGGEQHDLDLL